MPKEEKVKRPYLTVPAKIAVLSDLAQLRELVQTARVPQRVLVGSHQVACAFKNDVEQLQKLAARSAQLTTKHSGPKLLAIRAQMQQGMHTIR